MEKPHSAAPHHRKTRSDRSHPSRLREIPEDLRSDVEKYRSFFMNSPIGIFQSTPGGRFRMVNPAFAQTYGFGSADEMVREVDDIAELYHDPVQREAVKRQYAEKGYLFDYEVHAKRKDGREIWVSVFAKSRPGPSGEPEYYDGFALDITERKRAESDLRESENKYRNLFDLVSDAIFLIEKETGSILEVNSSACGLYGYTRDELLILRNIDLSAEPASTAEATKRERRTVPLRFHRRKDGTVFPVEITASHFKWQSRDVHLAAIRDISSRYKAEKERESLQKQLEQAQKMEAIGVLAGGVAHDFNNILAAVIGFIELARVNAAGGGSLDDLDQALNAAKRAKDLIKQILAFSRQSNDEKAPVRAGMVVKEVARFLRAAVPATIDIKTRIDDPSAAVLANSVELHQVIMNLCTNAVHAIGNQSGTVEIEVQRTTFDKSPIAGGVETGGGPCLKISVRDTGQGISPDQMDRIFDPYYTTKAKGTGTGLGLAVVHGIVKRAGGAVEVESEVGRGSAFHVYLPPADASAGLSSAGAPGCPRGGSERILFVDDEKMLAELGQKALESLGYRVVARTSPVEALELFTSRPDDFDLVITDQTMPGMSGDLLAQEVMRITPGIPVIVCTGYSQFIDSETAKARGIKALLLKPLLIGEIDAAIRKALGKE